MATVYWFSTVDTLWDTAGNWFSDSGHTTPYGSIPLSGDDVVMLGSTPFGTGPSVAITLNSFDSTGMGTGASFFIPSLTITSFAKVGVSGDLTSQHVFQSTFGNAGTGTFEAWGAGGWSMGANDSIVSATFHDSTYIMTTGNTLSVSATPGAIFHDSSGVHSGASPTGFLTGHIQYDGTQTLATIDSTAGSSTSTYLLAGSVIADSASSFACNTVTFDGTSQCKGAAFGGTSPAVVMQGGSTIDSATGGSWSVNGSTLTLNINVSVATSAVEGFVDNSHGGAVVVNSGKTLTFTGSFTNANCTISGAGNVTYSGSVPGNQVNISGTLTFSGNQTLSGQNGVSGNLAQVVGYGTLVVAGTASLTGTSSIAGTVDFNGAGNINGGTLSGPPAAVNFNSTAAQTGTINSVPVTVAASGGGSGVRTNPGTSGGINQ